MTRLEAERYADAVGWAPRMLSTRHNGKHGWQPYHWYESADFDDGFGRATLPPSLFTLLDGGTTPRHYPGIRCYRNATAARSALLWALEAWDPVLAALAGENAC